MPPEPEDRSSEAHSQPPDALNPTRPRESWDERVAREKWEEHQRQAKLDARVAVDPATLDRPAAPNDAAGTLDALRTEQQQNREALAGWLEAEPERTAPSVTTTISVDGIPVTGAPLDPTQQAAFVEEVRAARNRSAAEVAAIEAANQGARRCPI